MWYTPTQDCKGEQRGVFLFAVSFLTLLGVFFLLFYVFCERFVFLVYGEEFSYYGNSW